MTYGIKGEKVLIRMVKCLYIEGFPVKIVSGERWYWSGGHLRGRELVDAQGRPVTTINMPKRGFYLWRYGEIEPQLRTPGDNLQKLENPVTKDQ
jgi:hypothetical protein